MSACTFSAASGLVRASSRSRCCGVGAWGAGAWGGGPSDASGDGAARPLRGEAAEVLPARHDLRRAWGLATAERLLRHGATRGTARRRLERAQEALRRATATEHELRVLLEELAKRGGFLLLALAVGQLEQGGLVAHAPALEERLLLGLLHRIVLRHGGRQPLHERC